MRIIAGRFKGRKLKAPKGLQTRPVLGKVREALFNILGDVRGISMLDCFAGTGAMGIEALSRGATDVVFVEQEALPCGIIRENLTGIGDGATVIRGDVLPTLKMFAHKKKSFDFIFADPPYDQGLSQKTVEAACSLGILKQSGILAATIRSSEILPETAGAFRMVDNRKYGDTRLVLYAAAPEEESTMDERADMVSRDESSISAINDTAVQPARHRVKRGDG